jgi:toxin FitB
MIVLDSNVLSAVMFPAADAAAIRWLDKQPRASIWTTSVSIFEIRFGIETMPPGKRQAATAASFDHWLGEIIQERVATFDTLAAQCAAELAAERQKRGRPRELRDTMIAGIVLANHATLATRNVKHFEDIAKSVVNPWEE